MTPEELREKFSRSVDFGGPNPPSGGGPDDPGIGARLRAVEEAVVRIHTEMPNLAKREDVATLLATLPALAKKDDVTALGTKLVEGDRTTDAAVEKVRADVFKAINDQTWKLVAAAAGLVTAAFAIGKWLA